MLLFALFLVWLETSCGWVLRTNVDEIVPGKTPNVRLTCEMDNHGDGSIKLKDIGRVRIIKDPCCEKTVVANRRVRGNELVLQASDKSNASQVVLEVTWPVATKSMAGFYRCEVNGFDARDVLATEIVASTTIKERVVTMGDVQELMLSMTNIYDAKIKSLETENTNLRKLIEDKFQGLSQQIQSQDAKRKTEMSNNKREIEANYVKNDNFAAIVSMLKNFTLNEIKADNKIDEKMRNDLSNNMKQTEERCSKNYTQLESSYQNHENKLMSQLNILDQFFRQTYKSTNSRLSNVTDALNRMDNHFTDITDKLWENVTLNLEMCNCVPTHTTQVATTILPTTETTETTTKGMIDVEWPLGSYLLPSSGSQCPDSAFSPVSPYSFVAYSLLSESEINHGVFTISGSDGPSTFRMCGRTASPLTKQTPWPRGSYCILQHYAALTCPDSFSTERIQMVLKSYSGETKLMYHEKYCCRSDGRAQDAIDLPAEKPFMLYRYKGTCQVVRGMKAVPMERVLTSKYTSTISNDKAHKHPDFSNSSGTRVKMCGYLPKP